MKNIIWLASYPKSGNTWFRTFLANYQGQSEAVQSFDEIAGDAIASSAYDFEEELGLNPFELSPEEVDNLRPEMYRSLSMQATKEFLFKKVHDAYFPNQKGEALFPEEVSKGVIYFVRNPLDVCVSYANHNKLAADKQYEFLIKSDAAVAGKRRGQLRQRMGTWQEHYFSWVKQQNIPCLVIRYEDMKMKPFETFAAAVRFMGLPYDTAKLESAIANCEFSKLQKIEKEKGFKEKVTGVKQFFWKGEIGNYKDILTEEQRDALIAHSYEAMLELGYIDAERNLLV